jgi:hypothetical protein
LVCITLSYPDKVQRKTHFLSPEIKTCPSHFVLLCVALYVHLKKHCDGDVTTPLIGSSPIQQSRQKEIDDL